MCEFDVGSQVRFGTSRPRGPVWPGPGAGAEANPWMVLLRSHGRVTVGAGLSRLAVAVGVASCQGRKASCKESRR